MKEQMEQPLQYNIEQVSLKEWQQYKNLWLNAIKTDPQAFGYSYEEISNRTENDWKENISDYLDESNNNQVFVVKTEKEFIGMMGYFPKNETAQIYGVYIKPEFRSKGISSKLMNTIIEAIQNKNIFKSVELTVNKDQTAAINFYNRHGFNQTGEIDETMGDGKTYKVITMKREPT